MQQISPPLRFLCSHELKKLSDNLGRYITKQNKTQKVVKRVENNYILENTRQNEQKPLIPQCGFTKEQQREAMFPLNSSSSQASPGVAQFSSSFFFEEARLVSTYLRARVIPLVPVLPPHPACVRASDGGSYSRRGCDWDSHSTEHQAMRKPSQAAN